MVKEDKKKSLVNYIHIFAVPWCCILPIAIAVFGLAGGGLGIFLSRFTPLFLALSILLIGYANYNVWLGRYRTTNHRIYVSLITLISIALWLWSFSRMGWI
ncbi:MAG: hypothetical protein IIA85_03465 [Nanoarchaeota archaeon]|nr:hypothetical protein [Nanoarchaeota archaeon]